MDKLRLLKGDPYQITPDVAVRNPTLQEICDFGEKEYFDMLSHFTATSYDYRLALDEMGVDYVKVSDYQIFVNTCKTMNYDETKIIVPDIDFAKLNVYAEPNSGEPVLSLDGEKVLVNEWVFMEIADFIRNVHGFKRNFETPGNDAARAVFMQEAREAMMFADRKKFESILEPLVSALCNSEGFKYDFESVWELPIYTFINATRRIQKIKSAENLAGGVYSGNLDLSKMNKSQLNKDLDWMGKL